MKYAIAALMLAFSAGAGANDGIGAVAAGGIVFGKTDAVAMKKEVLNVGHDRITVDYEFLNESGADVEETIVFPMPAYPVRQQEADAYYGQPSGFTVTVDGKPVRMRTVVRALYADEDVTAQLVKAGLSDAQIAYGTVFDDQVRVPPLSAAQRRRLHDAGLFGDGPEWDAQVSYVWQQKFPSNRIVRVHHAYRPLVSAGPGESSVDSDTVKRYCADDAFLKGWDKVIERANSTPQGGYDAAKVAYILKTGNTWKNGIEDFTLNIVKSAPSELVTLCFPGTFKKIDARTYQVRLRNFRPTRDLDVFFGIPGGGGGIYAPEPPRLSR